MKVVFFCLGAATLAEPLGPTVTIAPGVHMPTVNLGTCCGSDPKVGLAPWLKAGGIGIDTAFNYHDQANIGQILKDLKIPRESVFITTKVPAGFGNATDCSADPSVVTRYTLENLRELGVDYVDLLLLHKGCGGSKTQPYSPTGETAKAANAALWKGASLVLERNLTRAIGVSHYTAPLFEALPSPVPAVNQCNMDVNFHDDATIAYCKEKGILYEAFGAMKGCPFKDSRVTSIAANHNVSAAQVCLRYIVEKGAAMAVGTGSDPTKSAKYAAENLDLFSWKFTEDEFKTVDAIGNSTHASVVV